MTDFFLGILTGLGAAIFAAPLGIWTLDQLGYWAEHRRQARNRRRNRCPR